MCFLKTLLLNQALLSWTYTSIVIWIRWNRDKLARKFVPLQLRWHIYAYRVLISYCGLNIFLPILIYFEGFRQLWKLSFKIVWGRKHLHNKMQWKISNFKPLLTTIIIKNTWVQFSELKFQVKFKTANGYHINNVCLYNAAGFYFANSTTITAAKPSAMLMVFFVCVNLSPSTYKSGLYSVTLSFAHCWMLRCLRIWPIAGPQVSQRRKKTGDVAQKTSDLRAAPATTSHIWSDSPSYDHRGFQNIVRRQILKISRNAVGLTLWAGLSNFKRRRCWSPPLVWVILPRLQVIDASQFSVVVQLPAISAADRFERTAFGDSHSLVRERGTTVCKNVRYVMLRIQSRDGRQRLCNKCQWILEQSVTRKYYKVA